MTIIQIADAMMAVGLSAVLGFELGKRKGKSHHQAEALARQASMRRHPSYKLRLKG